MPVNETWNPAAGVSVNVTYWLAAIADAWSGELNVLPPQARAAAVPLVPMPEPRVSPPTVTLAPMVVGVSGEGPKLPAPPGNVLRSHAATVAAWAWRLAVAPNSPKTTSAIKPM